MKKLSLCTISYVALCFFFSINLFSDIDHTSEMRWEWEKKELERQKEEEKKQEEERKREEAKD